MSLRSALLNMNSSKESKGLSPLDFLNSLSLEFHNNFSAKLEEAVHYLSLENSIKTREKNNLLINKIVSRTNVNFDYKGLYEKLLNSEESIEWTQSLISWLVFNEEKYRKKSKNNKQNPYYKLFKVFFSEFEINIINENFSDEERKFLAIKKIIIDYNKKNNELKEFLQNKN